MHTKAVDSVLRLDTSFILEKSLDFMRDASHEIKVGHLLRCFFACTTRSASRQRLMTGLRKGVKITEVTSMAN